VKAGRCSTGWEDIVHAGETDLSLLHLGTAAT
jgi:hypothetical protein